VPQDALGGAGSDSDEEGGSAAPPGGSAGQQAGGRKRGSSRLGAAASRLASSLSSKKRRDPPALSGAQSAPAFAAVSRLRQHLHRIASSTASTSPGAPKFSSRSATRQLFNRASEHE
jgi:hypothetical protein